MADARKARPEVNALVAELLLRLAQSEVRDLEVRRSGIRVRVSRGPLGVSAGARPAAHSAPAALVPTLPGPAQAAAVPAAPGANQITAPLTGIFYRSSSPQIPPFVQVGSMVAEGEVVALIEAMKLFNEIRSTKSGVVRKVLAENGALVKAHQPLFELEGT